MAQDTRWFNPKGGDYFHMNDRGRFTRKQHNPNNVHIGEGYGGGPLSIGNPRNDTMQLAELTQKQKNYMGKVEHTPAFGIPKKDLYDKVKKIASKLVSKIKDMIKNFYNNVLKKALENIKEFAKKGFDVLVDALGIEITGIVDVKVKL